MNKLYVIKLQRNVLLLKVFILKSLNYKKYKTFLREFTILLFSIKFNVHSYIGLLFQWGTATTINNQLIGF